jgi:hypothetical protein
MARLRIPLLLCLALLASGAALGAGVPELRGPSMTVSGVYSVTFHLNIASTLPAGTTITCRARIAPNPEGLDLRNPQPTAAPATGLATVTGSTATCAAEIPFSWTVTGGQGGLATGQDGFVLSYQIDAVSNSGSAPLLVRSSAQQSIRAAFPAVGGSARLSINLAF